MASRRDPSSEFAEWAISADTAEFYVSNRDDLLSAQQSAISTVWRAELAPACAKRGVLETSHGFWLAKEKQGSKIDSAVAPFAPSAQWQGSLSRVKQFALWQRGWFFRASRQGVDTVFPRLSRTQGNSCSHLNMSAISLCHLTLSYWRSTWWTINGIKFVDRHELAEFSRVVGLGLEALQLLTVICT